MSDVRIRIMPKERHIVSLSGGKDSTALAIFLQKNFPDKAYEFVFCDTGEELPETYSYLEKIETYLGKKIVRLRAERTWDQFLEDFSGYLPSARSRWCTANMKIKPFEDYIGDDVVISYIGIRADENGTPKYPFKEHGIDKEGVMRILDESGLGLPDYYKWRTRFKWLGLKENHPHLYEKAKQYETSNKDGSAQNFTWIQGGTLEQILKDEDGIKRRHDQYETRVKRDKQKKSKRLIDVFSSELSFEDALNMEDDAEGCLVCHV
ncbi:MAG: phosphoadenosine phosphosulfate reductase family protein [Leptospiraceae bacterium]|nr:phosphoadenosine phosphosulfate reductase family protein [Leptospiraceae bacterium]